VADTCGLQKFGHGVLAAESNNRGIQGIVDSFTSLQKDLEPWSVKEFGGLASKKDLGIIIKVGHTMVSICGLGTIKSREEYC
jgi:hypothetical protein